MKLILALTLLAVSLFLVISPTPAFAQGQAWGDCVVKGVPTLRCIPVLFQNVVNGALMFVGIVAVIMLVWGGMKMINSGGDQKQTGEARKILTYAILGVILVLGSFAIIYFIGFVTNTTNCITDIDKVSTGGCN